MIRLIIMKLGNTLNHSDFISTLYVVLGDLNFPYINWDTYTGPESNPQLFADLSFDLNLTQLILQHTHRNGNILDVVLTNSNVIHNTNVPLKLPDGLTSDHFAVTFLISDYILKALLCIIHMMPLTILKQTGRAYLVSLQAAISLRALNLGM